MNTNGQVGANGQPGAPVYDYPGTGNLDTTSLGTALGNLADNTEVSIQCYWTGAPVQGPNATNAQGGGTDDFWDQIIGASTTLPGPQSLSTGHTYVVPDADIDTSPKTVDQIAQPCTAPPAAPQAPGGAANGGGPPAQAPQSWIVTATPTGTENPFKQVLQPGGIFFCYVGTVHVECTATHDGPLGDLNTAPESYVSQIAHYANEAGVDPRLMLIILWSESNRPHSPAADQATTEFDQAKCNLGDSVACLGPSLGIADMKKQTFDQVQGRHSDLFPPQSVHLNDLSGNTDLAIRMLAWALHDISSYPDPTNHNVNDPDRQLPGGDVGGYSPQQLLAMAYSKGIGSALKYAKGGAERATVPGNTQTDLQNYANRVSQYWNEANQIFCNSGAFTCTPSA
ncbi:MAG: hypothetical protein JOY82_24965 [Streptosporangiaceae bacterium]|nr:hypothetical protein [Streptosporangiaceae bacterium]MBV9857737.1 hypothetical protein [Streptosporangiaceae bacterium]